MTSHSASQPSQGARCPSARPPCHSTAAPATRAQAAPQRSRSRHGEQDKQGEQQQEGRESTADEEKTNDKQAAKVILMGGQSKTWSEPKENFRAQLIIFLRYLNKSTITIPISALNYFFYNHKTRIHGLKSGRYLQNGFRNALRVFLASSVSPVTWRCELCIVCLGKWVEGGGR